MNTLLGTEKYAVMVLMLGLAVGGVSLMTWWGARSAWIKRDVAIIVFLVTILLGAGVHMSSSIPVGR